MQDDPSGYGQAQTPYGQTPYAQTPTAQTPYAQTPTAQTPYTQTPTAQTPYAQTPTAQTPYAQTPYAQTPYAQTPYAQTPYAQSPYAQPYDVEQVTEDYKEDNAGWLTLSTVCTAVVLLMVIVLAMLLVTGTIGQSSGTTETEEAPGLSEQPSRVLVHRTVTTTQSTPAPVIIPRPSTAATPGGNHSTGFADRQPLVCIMGDRLKSVHQFPPDDLCNYIFYDSLYKEIDRNLLPHENTYAQSLNVFLNDHRGYQHTTLGLGFAFEFLDMAIEDLKVRNPSPLAPFWNRGIFHAGILDTPMQTTRAQTKAAISSLKTINRLLDSQRSRGDFAITVMAVPHPEFDWSQAFAMDFSDLRFTPYLFISFGHYRRGDNFHKNCAIMPPTRHPDDSPPDAIFRDYNFDVSTPVFSLRELYAMGVDTRGLVSVTLKGRWAHPLSTNNVGFFKPCVSDAIIVSFGKYSDVCPGGGAQFVAQLDYSSEHHAVITYIASLRRTFVYDDERAFAEKLCKAKALGTDVPFGIAAYDLDFDDFENRCSRQNVYGAFSHLKALRKIVDYFKGSGDSFDESTCRNYATT